MSEPKFGDSVWDLLWKICENTVGVYDRLAQILTAIVTSGGGTSTGFSTSGDLVIVAGTATQCASHACQKGALFVASSGNTGSAFLGGSNVTNTAGSFRGMELLPSGMTPVFIPCSNTNQVYINGSNSGDHVGIVFM